MTSETIWTRIREKPFKPFRLNTSDGKHYDVSHPEMIHISKSRIVIAIFDKEQNPDEEVPERDVTISPLHVASLEDMPFTSRQAG